jgi:hypothetical protein
MGCDRAAEAIRRTSQKNERSLKNVTPANRDGRPWSAFKANRSSGRKASTRWAKFGT